jgi:hypothetical protein
LPRIRGNVNSKGGDHDSDIRNMNMLDVSEDAYSNNLTRLHKCNTLWNGNKIV